MVTAYGSYVKLSITAIMLRKRLCKEADKL